MPEFTVDPGRHDPYRNFRFRILWDGKAVAGVSRVSGLARTTEVARHRDGADPSSVRLVPGQTSFEPITIERGVSHDAAFEQWANKVWDFSAGTTKDFRKDVRIELYNEAGQLVLAYNVHRCWPSQFIALPELDGDGGALAIQTLVLQNEGWERDLSVVEPAPAK